MRISVIIPAFDGAATLPVCLRALENSRRRADECIVIDDGSSDNSALLAERSGATVLSTGGRHGPARARNLGARHASGDLLVFLDADVEIHADALGRIVQRFEAAPELDALIGSYDDSPSDPGLVSQFKNLMHSFVHHHGNPQASTFWCGCGVVRRTVYLELGGLDESYVRPSIEDIEFGFRAMRSGRKLALDPLVQCKHLKVWTLWSLIRTDVWQRGIPWTELILRTRFLPNDLNLRWSQRVSVLLSFAVLGLSLALAAWTGAEVWKVFGPEGSGNEAAMPPLMETAGILVSLASIYLLNRAFYEFLASRKGCWFSVRAIPLHILYYVYSGVSFAAGAMLFGFKTVFPRYSAAPAAPKIISSGGEDLP